MNKEEVGLVKDVKIIYVVGIKLGKNKKIVDLVKFYFYIMQFCFNFYKIGICNVFSGNLINFSVNFLLVDYDVNRFFQFSNF